MKKKIAKFLGITIITIVSAVILFTSIAALIFYLYPQDKVLSLIKTKAEATLHRKVDIKSINYSIKGVVLHGVLISDIDENGNLISNDKPLLKADEALISYSILSILKKDFTIKTLYFNKLSVRLVFDDKGVSNLEKLIKELKENAEPADKTEKTTLSISKIILTNCRLIVVNPPKFIKPLEGDYLVNSTINIKDSNRFLFSDSGIVLPSGRGTVYPDIEINTADRFRLTGNVNLENCLLGWVYTFTLKPLPLPFESVSGIIKNFEITSSAIKGQAKVTSILKYNKNRVNAEGSCIVDLESRNVIIKGVQNKLNNSTSTLENLTINYKSGTVTRFIVTGANYSIADLRYLEPEIPSGFAGNLKGSLSYNGATYSGKLQISDCSFTDKTEILSGLNTDIEITNNVFKKENIPVTFFGSNFNVSIATTDNRFRNIYVFIKGSGLDINKITFSSGNSSSDFFFPINISGKIQLGELKYKGFVFKNNSADFAASGKTIKVNRADTSILSGSITGSGKIELSGSSPSTSMNARLSNIKINDYKFEDENLNGRLFGFADGSANLAFNIKENMTETLKGNLTFSVSKGKVVNTGIQNGLIIFMSELRYKLKDLEFNKIYGNIDVNGKNLLFNSFIFNSEDIRLSMNGKMNTDLIADGVQMKLEFNDHFIKDIPRPAVAVFNEYLSGKWYTIPFLLNGNITDSKNIRMLKKNQ